MPGVVTMESGASHFQSTNHDRSNGSLTNGAPDTINGIAGHAGNYNTVNTDAVPNGTIINVGNSQSPGPFTSRMNDLPDEIQHITQGFVPLSALLSRLSQQTHNQLGDEIMALAKMSLPSSTMNGNTVGIDVSSDDNSLENLNKKVRLLNFVQEKHGEWVKALIIANWSRKAQPVSKLIDLMHHINKTRAIYQGSLDYMINIKRDLTYARIPNPDLRTALHVLSTGQAPWMPELNYVQSPQITPEEQMRWIENLNTLLSIRLNLEDHENIPEQFQDFEIDSGRVTFRVPGEFEIDLTIADEDPEKQFWFIDFRFAFQPAPSELSDRLRDFLEMKVNEALQKDGLHGCYKFLHEFILTHKITEYVRQAMDLSKGRWADMLEVERLRRAMAIHYWSGRQPLDGPQSYIIMGVSSGREFSSSPNQNTSSRLTLRWFREGVEIKDIQFPLDEPTISTELLLNRVIGQHIEHILRRFHDAMKIQGRFVRREASLGINIVNNNPGESALTIQLNHEQYLTLKVAPITGTLLAISPQSRGSFDLQSQLNKDSRRPVTEHVALLEKFRCYFVEDELNRRGKSRGWSVCNPHPVKLEETRQFLGTRGAYQLIWLKRRGIPDNWYIMVSQSLSGDQWWLIEVIKPSGSTKITTHPRLPLSPSMPRYSDRFFAELTFFSSAIISQIGILGAMHRERIKYCVQDRVNPMLPPNMKVPSIHVRLSEILGRHQSHISKHLSSWAFDFVEINVKNIEHKLPQSSGPPTTGGTSGKEERPASLAQEQHRYNIVVDARVKVADPSRFGPLKGNVEHDVAFNERLGVFALSIDAEVGSSILDTLAHRLQALGRLASSIDTIRQSRRDVQCEDITLSNVRFSYTDQARPTSNETQQNVHRWSASLDLQTDNMKLVLDQNNPQIRATDQFNKLINSKEGFKAVPWFLSITLPIHRALNSVEQAWEAPTITNQCHVSVSVISLDCYTVQYVMGPSKGMSRCLTLHIRLQNHNTRPEWHIYREEAGPNKQPDDEFHKVLQKLWLSDKRVWRYLGTSVAADVTHGVEILIKAMDEAVRPLVVVRSPSASKQPQPKAVGAKNVGPNKNIGANKPRPQQTASGGPIGSGGPVVISLDD
ncbi:mediator complex subunit MED14 [Xylaria bambusicola]|uniref:mediator complex subunit MED14 n=1 Tax=Xylaria bambusicola TaxID=326684 RepID=UPI0020073527|nr:mediator complex subunit MED14 [Xylaria bambusicola]KAI0515288.1 mediator complex subunit MED14 [Xylaria bambusicola]